MTKADKAYLVLDDSNHLGEEITLVKEFHSKCYVFGQLGQCYHVKLAEIINTQHPDNCFKNLMEIIDWDFKSTVESCIIDILLDIMDYP